VAAATYVAGLTTPQAATDWHAANVQARRDVISALRASACLNDVEGALKASGAYLRVFRHILAPPISQDQFKLFCPTYSKVRENSGSPIPDGQAPAIAAYVETLPRTVTWG